jgi:tetratricopeptide (TPR) repeat protein
MKAQGALHNCIVAALLAIVLQGGIDPAAAQTTPPAAATAPDAQPPTVDELFQKLKDADARAARRVEREIWNAWSKSGSASADLLLQRGRNAMGEGKTDEAIEHLTALVDHAPEFAEGWNARATAYFQAGQFGPSVADIAQVLRLEPRHFGALAGFGAILEATDRKAEALEVYRAALAIHPHLAGVKDAVARLEQEQTGQDL